MLQQNIKKLKQVKARGYKLIAGWLQSNHQRPNQSQRGPSQTPRGQSKLAISYWLANKRLPAGFYELPNSPSHTLERPQTRFPAYERLLPSLAETRVWNSVYKNFRIIQVRAPKHKFDSGPKIRKFQGRK